MKVFLSHSSKDKGFVEAVASLLKPGSYELDAETFDAGAINSQAILRALQRSSLFCLFLSTQSVKSAYVEFETLLGLEFFANGRVGQFLAICLDEAAFALASNNVKYFNVVRKSIDVEATARLIQGQLISAAEQASLSLHPFIGRDDDMRELERQLMDPQRPPSKALFVSGNFGAGRRAVAKKVFSNLFPKVSQTFPTFFLDPFSGLEELHRKLISTLRPTISTADLRVHIQAFTLASQGEKRRLIAQLVNSMLASNDALLIVDRGGLLTDAAAFATEINDVISLFEARPHPPAVFIASRRMPLKVRRVEDDVSYLPVNSLKPAEAERLIGVLLKDIGEKWGQEEMSQMASLGDGHPFNIYRMVAEVKEKGVAVFLANPSDFVEWKHRHSSEYIGKIEFGEGEREILGLLKQAPELDFESIVNSLGLDPNAASDDLSRLTGRHVVEASLGSFAIAPPLRIAVERDKRLVISSQKRTSAIQNLARTLTMRIEEGTAPIILLDTAVLAAIEAGDIASTFAAAFILPSHYVWLAKRHYDSDNFPSAIKYGKEAIKGVRRLSVAGIVASCRYLCLAAARMNDQQTFDDGMGQLKRVAKDDWARSNIAYLNGFNFRLRGQLLKAEDDFREAYRLSPGNLAAARELASICLVRGNLDEAETFARQAYEHGHRNPYFVDVLIAVLIKKYGRRANGLTEINDLFAVLEEVGEEGGRSFYTTRRAEFEHLWGNNREAMRLIDVAAAKTPRIFETRRLQTEIYLKDGNKIKAREILELLQGIVSQKDFDERRSNYRMYLETRAHYLTETGQWGDAKGIYDDKTMFTDTERAAAVREIEIIQGYKQSGR